MGPGGLLQGLAKGVLESALAAELDEHLGYGPTTLPAITAATPAAASGLRRS